MNRRGNGVPGAPLDIPDDDSEASDDDELPIPEEEDDLCPTIVLTREEKARLRKPWKQALIIKLLGRSIGYNSLSMRLKQLWAPKGQFDLIDIGNDYYVARFHLKEDSYYALTGGPWPIADHYLTVRQRSFACCLKPAEGVITKLAAWVRIPGLSLEYFYCSSVAPFITRPGSIALDREGGHFTTLFLSAKKSFLDC